LCKIEEVVDARDRGKQKDFGVYKKIQKEGGSNTTAGCKGAYAGARQYMDIVWYTVAHGRE